MSRVKKVIFVSRYFYPHTGGVENHIKELTKMMNRSGNFEVVVITGRYENFLPKNEKYEKTQVIRIRYPYVRFIGILYLWLQFLFKIKIFLEADIIHIHDVFIWVLPIRLILFWKNFYITFHGWEGMYPIPNGSIFQKQVAAKLTNANICVGKYLEKIYSIHSTFIIYGATKSRKKMPEINSTKIIFVGRLEEATGALTLVNALRSMKFRPPVVFYGDGTLRVVCEEVGEIKDINGSGLNIQAGLCFAGGYLTTLDSLASGTLTSVITHNHVRRLAFYNTPFSKWIIKCNDETQVVKLVSAYYKKLHLINTSLVNDAQTWAVKQSWEKVFTTYNSLWRR